MAHRVKIPSGNVYTEYAIHIVKLYEGKGVLCLDARNKPLEYVPVADIEKGRRVRDMLNGALNGERRYRNLDWTFLDEPSPSMPPQAEQVKMPVPVPAPAPALDPVPEPEALPAPAPASKPKNSK